VGGTEEGGAGEEESCVTAFFFIHKNSTMSHSTHEQGIVSSTKLNRCLFQFDDNDLIITTFFVGR
jgi:hypothetical protein